MAYTRKYKIEDSSNIYRLDYSPEAVKVVFVNGQVYEYEKVPFQVYAKVIGSESVGTAFNELIRAVYPTKKAIV